MIYSFSHYDTPGKAPFAWWENFLTEEEISQIVNTPEWNKLIQAKVNSGSVNGSVNLDVRETEIAWYYRTHENNHIWDKLALAAIEINKRYFDMDLSGFFEPAQLGYYSADKKSHYTWHIDANMDSFKPVRKLSMVLQLNDPCEFEGGQLQLKYATDEPISLDIRKGRAWFFPSYLLHRVTPVTRGVRKSLVLWITGPEFK